MNYLRALHFRMHIYTVWIKKTNNHKRVASLILERIKERFFKFNTYQHRRGSRTVRSAKKCRRCILGQMYSANQKLESQNLTSVQCIVYTVQGGGGCLSNSGTLASNRQNTAFPSYNDDISLLILQYPISVYLHETLFYSCFSAHYNCTDVYVVYCICVVCVCLVTP